MDTENLLRLLNAHAVDYVIIGASAFPAHGYLRATEDIDIFFQSETDIKNLVMPGFKLTRAHALTHLATGVEVELLTPEFLKVDKKLIRLAISTATLRDGIRVVSKEGLVALKLQRLSDYDIGDIKRIIRDNGPLNLSQYPLTPKQLAAYKQCEVNVKYI